MRRRIGLAIGVLLVLGVAATVAWKLRARKGTSPATSASVSETDVGARKRTHRSDAPAPAAASGRVSRAADGAGLAGAVVSLAPRALSRAGAMDPQSAIAQAIVLIADGSGRWSATGVPPGRYTLTATLPGFLPGLRDDITLAPGQTATGLDVALAAGGVVISGTVSDINAGRIAGARVLLRSDEKDLDPGSGAFAAVTRDDGTFELGVPDGTWRATASHVDYTRTSQTFQVQGAPRVVDFVLSPGGGIRGQVIARADGKSVAGAIVTADGGHTADRSGSDTIDATADGDGNFVLRGLGSGAISLAAHGPGSASMVPTVVELGIGEEVDAVKVLVDRAFAISGVVVSAENPAAGVAGIQVAATSLGAGETREASAPTSADGYFEILGVQPGKYILSGIGEDLVPAVGQAVVVADRDVGDVVLTMEDGATLSGRLSEPTAARLWLEVDNTNLTVDRIYDVMKAGLVHGEADDQGAFALPHLPAGSFTLVARTVDGSEGRLPLVITAEDRSGLVIPLERRATISGRVIDAAGKPVAGVAVDIKAEATLGGRMHAAVLGALGKDHDGAAITAADGRFRATGLASGKQLIRVSDERGPLVWADEAHRAKPSASIKIEIRGAEDVTGVTLTVESRDAVIKGVVLGPDGAPARDAWVTARRQKPLWSGEPPVLTGDDGRFEITHLRGGTYALIGEGGNARARKDEVRAGDTVTLKLEALGSLSGVVRRAETPVADYTISCDGPVSKIKRRIVSSDATYHLERLPSGNYTCTARTDTGVVTREIAIEAGRAATLDLVIGEWGSVRGRVVDAFTRQAMSGARVMVNAGSVDGDAYTEVLTRNGPVTDADGRFLVERIGAGEARLVVNDGDLTRPMYETSFTMGPGQAVDVGTLAALPAHHGPPGTLGLGVETKGEKVSPKEPATAQVIVTEVFPDGPAAGAGVRQGDVITAIDGHTVVELGWFAARELLLPRHLAPGQVVQLTIKRGGATVAITVTAQVEKRE